MSKSKTARVGDTPGLIWMSRSNAAAPSSSADFDCRYVSPKEAARYLGLSVFSIYRLVQRRAIPFIPLHPSGISPTSRPSVRFDLQALDAWMKKHTVKPLAEYVDERATNE